MSHQSTDPAFDAILAEIKYISGRRIEEHRKRLHLTQERLAARVGIGARWLREIEGGNPKSRLDDHIRCAHGLGLTCGFILIPMMFQEHGVTFPRPLLFGDLADLERRCVAFIADHSLDTLARQMRATS